MLIRRNLSLLWILAGIIVAFPLPQTLLAQPTVTLVVTPNIREINLANNPPEMSIIAEMTPPDAQPIWTFSGPGTFQGDLTGAGIVYTPPQTLTCASAQVAIAVTVTDSNGAKTTERVTLTLIAPAPPATPTPKTPLIRLRSQRQVVSEEQAQRVFNLDINWRPRLYIENDFEAQVGAIFDRVTGLTWHQAGFPKMMTYQEAQQYISQLNQERFAGYDDWRLPTVDELVSLLEPGKQSNGLYLNSIFDSTREGCWSADTVSSGAAWYVHFGNGNVYYRSVSITAYVRAMRSGQ